MRAANFSWQVTARFQIAQWAERPQLEEGLALLPELNPGSNSLSTKGISIMKCDKGCTAASILLAGLLLTTAGCSTSSKDERSEGRSLDDKHLTERIQKSMDEDPVYKFGGVHVKAFAGEVQLSGFVNTDEQKRRADEIAQE